MAIIARETHKLFGNAGATTYFAEFGSLVAAAPLKTKDIASIQALPAWDDGWQESIFGANKDLLLQDLNGWCFEHSYQVAYIFQWGIPEYDAGTEYETGSVVQGKKGAANAGQWFVSLQDGNTGNTPPTSADNAFWRWANRPIPTNFGVGSGVKERLVVKPNAITPASKVDVSAKTISVQGPILSNFADTINFATGGLHGIDVGGGAAANTLYALYIVCDASGSITFGAVASTNFTQPAMPAGTTQYRYVGSVFTDGAGNIIPFQMTGDWWFFQGATPLVLNNPGLNTNFRTVGVPNTSQLVAANISVQTSAGQLTYKTTGSAAPALTVGVIDVTNGHSVHYREFALSASQQGDFVSSGAIVITILGYYDPT